MKFVLYQDPCIICPIALGSSLLGGKISGPSLGTWNIPTIIEDEDSYRCKILNVKPTTVVQADVDKCYSS